MHTAKPSMRELLRVLRPQTPAMLRLLRRLVLAESPSSDKAAVDRLGRLVAAEWRRRGARVALLRQRRRGDHVRAEWWRGKRRPPGQILVLGHLDTVYPRGTLEKMPFRIAGGRAWGPGTFDMKSGLVQALFAMDALAACHAAPAKRLVFLWTTDEEIGSASSRAAIEREARRSDAVLVLEPAFGRHGHLKTQRKGVGTVELRVEGRAAHAGINPEQGVNAVHELALQIGRLRRMNRSRRGITVQANVIAGGTVSNVVPAQARAEVDVRVARIADGRAIERKLRALRPVLRGAQLEVSIGVFRPPLERTPAVRAIFRRAQSLAHQMGLPLGEAATGGGSDGNLTAALGVPTLDGLGGVGDGAHSPREFVLIRALPERAAILAGLLATL
ncbi:MAG TPA: M20/M25/M40 family metallo-hydrolase [Candidatus Acidoferrales bacterium]|jgi:glutamate carboxypeptidase|nr:M20/M25/M40 family metallo-hydrolase [Candidatus Acidoferrales bacterium]